MSDDVGQQGIEARPGARLGKRHGIVDFLLDPRCESFDGFAADYDLLGTRYILRDASNADVPHESRRS